MAEEIKKVSIYDDVDFNSQNLQRITAGTDFLAELKLKTDSVLRLHIPFSHSESEEVTQWDFSVVPTDGKMPVFLQEVKKKSAGNSILVLKFPEGNDISSYIIKCGKDVNFLLNDSGKLQAKQYGLPSKFLKLFIVAYSSACLIFLLICFLLIKMKCPAAIKLLFFNLSVGLALIFILPPYIVPDEGFHVNTAYEISNIWLKKGSSVQNGGLLMRNCDRNIYPQKDIEHRNNLESIVSIYDEIDEYKKYYGFAFPKLLQKAPDLELSLFNIEGRICDTKRWYFYYPYALGMTIARKYDLNQFWLYYMGCIFGLLINTLILFFPFIKTGCKNVLFFFVSMNLYLIQQMSHYTYDGMIYPLAIGFLTFFFSFYERKKMIDFIFSIIYVFFLFNAKSKLYTPLLLCYFLCIPNINSFFSRKRKIIILLTLVCLIVFLVNRITFVIKNPEKYTAVYYHLMRRSYFYYLDAAYIRGPFSYLARVFRTFDINFNKIFYVWLGVTFSEGQFSINMSLVIMNIAVLYYTLRNKNTILVTPLMNRFLLLITAVISVAIITHMYSTFGNKYIADGIQGRYFIPILIPMLILVKNRFKKNECDESDLIIYSFMLWGFVASVNVLEIFLR